MVVHHLASSPQQQNQVDVYLLALGIQLNAVLIKLFLVVENNLIVELRDFFAQFVAHNFELGQDGPVVETGHSKVGQVLLRHLAGHDQRPVRAIEKLLVLLGRLPIDVVEELDGVP